MLADIKARRDLGASLAGLDQTVRVATSFDSGAPFAGGPCKIERKAKVSLKDAKKVGDYLAAEKAAQQAKDAAAAEQANQGARDAYGEWADGEMASGASTVGDYLTIAQGAQMMGVEQVSQRAMDQARRAADRDIKTATEDNFDPCTVSTNDIDCQSTAVAVGQLVGSAGSGDAAASMSRTLQAIEDRLNKKQLDDCEEWSLSITLVAKSDQSPTTWTIRWLESRFRVNRKLKLLDASRGAGYAKDGWDGFIGDFNDHCIETVDGVRHDLGPASVKGGPFHYTVIGSVTDDGFSLELASADANYTMTVPGNLGCQALKFLGDLVVKRMLHGPLPLDIPIAPGQNEVAVDDSSDGADTHIRLRRIM